MNEKDIKRLSKHITGDPDIILENIEGDLGYFLTNANLHPKESNFQVGTNTEDDPGDYPNALASGPQRSHTYVEEIYGGAELRLDIPIENVPPYIGWYIEHQNTTVGRYKEENGRIISYRENRPVGILVFSDDMGDSVVADAAFMMEALDMELYTVRDELEIDIPLDVIEDLSWHLEITWVNWEFEEGRLGCTIGVEVVIE
jgi:hypothetical protein